MEGEGGEMEEEKSVGDPERALYLLRYMEPIREQVKAEETAAAADDEGGGGGGGRRLGWERRKNIQEEGE